MASKGFLDLPSELRNIIYEYTLGDKDIHIRWNGGRTFSSLICQAESASPVPEDDAQPTGDTSEKKIPSYFSMHAECISWQAHRTNTLSVNLLRTCKKIYQEARLIPFACNTFMFESPGDFHLFVRALNPTQRAAVCSAFFFHFVRETRIYPTRTYNIIDIASLPALTHLSILFWYAGLRYERRRLTAEVFGHQRLASKLHLDEYGIFQDFCYAAPRKLEQLRFRIAGCVGECGREWAGNGHREGLLVPRVFGRVEKVAEGELMGEIAAKAGGIL